MALGASLLLWQHGWSSRHTGCHSALGLLGLREGNIGFLWEITALMSQLSELGTRYLPHPALAGPVTPQSHPFRGLLLFLPLERFGGNPEKLPGFIMQLRMCMLILYRAKADDICLPSYQGATWYSLRVRKGGSCPQNILETQLLFALTAQDAKSKCALRGPFTSVPTDLHATYLGAHVTSTWPLFMHI